MQRMPETMRCLIAAAALAGCTAPSQLPLDWDLERAAIEPLPLIAQVRLEEDGWSSHAANKGGIAGASIGLGAGGLLCTGAGPLAPLCFVTIMPLSAGVGAVSGAVAGATYDRNSAQATDKKALLQPAWTSLAERAPLAELVRRRLAPQGDADTTPVWRASVGYAVLGTDGSGADRPFALQATARLALWHGPEERPRAEKVYLAQSAERLTTPQWSAADAQALRGALDELAEALASQIAGDLARPTEAATPSAPRRPGTQHP